MSAAIVNMEQYEFSKPQDLVPGDMVHIYDGVRWYSEHLIVSVKRTTAYTDATVFGMRGVSETRWYNNDTTRLRIFVRNR